MDPSMRCSPRRLALALAVASVGALAVAACTGGPSPGSTHDAPPEAGPAPTTRRTPTDGGYPPEAIPEPPPGVVPDGWVLETAYRPACGFYVPSAPEYFPPPLHWEPCSARLGDAGAPVPDSAIACRVALSDWNPREDVDTSIISSTSVSTDGRLLFAQLRIHPGIKHEYVVVEADGPVRQALISTGSCSLWGGGSLQRDSILYGVIEGPANLSDSPGGAIGGRVGEPLRALISRGYASGSYGLAAGATTFVEGNGNIRSFADGSHVARFDKAYAFYQYSNDDIFAPLDKALWAKPAGGTARVVLGPYAGDSQIGGFATDGVDMVWAEAAGPIDPVSKQFASYEIWTAKYSTDPAAVAATKRRVRSADPLVLIDRPAVGCGYVAHQHYVPGDQHGVRLIRLSDGRTWDVMSSDIYLPLWQAHAITCTELFGGGRWPIRVRIDSLGPGTLPD
jgi:hypothetical protein